MTDNDEAPWRDEEKLRELYCDKKLSQAEMGERWGCEQSTVGEWMDRHGIETRDLSESRRIRAQKKPLPLRQDKNGYMVWRDEYKKKEGEPKERVPVHRLLYVAEHGFEAVRDMDVHHRNGVKWDNRPENLEALTRSEHVRRHNIKRATG